MSITDVGIANAETPAATTPAAMPALGVARAGGRDARELPCFNSSTKRSLQRASDAGSAEPIACGGQQREPARGQRALCAGNVTQPTPSTAKGARTRRASAGGDVARGTAAPKPISARPARAIALSGQRSCASVRAVISPRRRRARALLVEACQHVDPEDARSARSARARASKTGSSAGGRARPSPRRSRARRSHVGERQTPRRDAFRWRARARTRSQHASGTSTGEIAHHPAIDARRFDRWGRPRRRSGRPVASRRRAARRCVRRDPTR